ncbi:MAG: hypothetical protein HKN82_06230 [Akkermansiaceae bacterium]|nr:hypothetical protein [Akkermansiaceae bacterium]NNM30777.1 hypothetical protein [Akkermansiaceae bacterium]
MIPPHSWRRLALVFVAAAAPAAAQENLRSMSLSDLVQAQFTSEDDFPESFRAKRIEPAEPGGEAAAPAHPAPLPEAASIELPESGEGAAEHVLESGGTLGKISALHYDSPAYAPLVKLYNRVDERRLKVGQVIKTPSIATILREAGSRVLVRYPEEMRGILEVRNEYMEIESAVSSGASIGAIAEELKPRLRGLRRKLEAISYGLEKRKHGVAGAPNSTLSQLQSVRLNLQALERADFGKHASRPGRVHTHLGLALTYAILWGEEGFK